MENQCSPTIGYYAVILWMMCLAWLGATNTEHDQHLMAALSQLDKAGVTLNLSKCQFNCNFQDILSTSLKL